MYGQSVELGIGLCVYVIWADIHDPDISVIRKSALTFGYKLKFSQETTQQSSPLYSMTTTI